MKRIKLKGRRILSPNEGIPLLGLCWLSGFKPSNDNVDDFELLALTVSRSQDYNDVDTLQCTIR